MYANKVGVFSIPKAVHLLCASAPVSFDLRSDPFLVRVLPPRPSLVRFTAAESSSGSFLNPPNFYLTVKRRREGKKERKKESIHDFSRTLALPFTSILILLHARLVPALPLVLFCAPDTGPGNRPGQILNLSRSFAIFVSEPSFSSSLVSSTTATSELTLVLPAAAAAAWSGVHFLGRFPACALHTEVHVILLRLESFESPVKLAPPPFQARVSVRHRSLFPLRTTYMLDSAPACPTFRSNRRTIRSTRLKKYVACLSS